MSISTICPYRVLILVTVAIATFCLEGSVDARENESSESQIIFDHARTSPENEKTDYAKTVQDISAEEPPDFQLERPRSSVSIRGQLNRARTEGDLFSFFNNQLTLGQGDYNGPGIVADVSFGLSPRLDVRVGVDFSQSSARSNYRDFTDANGFEIEQRTTLQQVDLTGSVEFALTSRGRQIGQYTWIPSRVVPYIGGGGGFLRYRLQQTGDFVDIIDLSIFTACSGTDDWLCDTSIEERGWTPSAHVFAGVDIRLTQNLFVTLEARHVWVYPPELDGSFSSFEPIDLNGLRIATGIRLAF